MVCSRTPTDSIKGDEELYHPIVVNTPVKPFNSYENNPDSDSDGIIDSKDSEPEVYCQNVSDCIFYNTYDPNFDGAEYYSKYVEGYVNEDVTRHATVPAIIIGENDNFEYMGYVCENCEHVFLSPEEQDKEILTVSQYTLVNALQVAFINCVNNGDEKGAESLYHIIDDIRVMASAYRYEYCDASGRYVSPMQYQYTAEDIDNYVIINMKQYASAVEAAQDAALEFDVSSGFFLLSAATSFIPNPVVKSIASIAVATVSLAYSIYTFENEDSIVSVSNNGISLIAEMPFAPSDLKNNSECLGTLFYLYDTYKYFENISSSTFTINNYSICIELKSSETKTIYDCVYQFNSKDSIYANQTVKRVDETINNPNLYNTYHINCQDVTGLLGSPSFQSNLVS